MTKETLRDKILTLAKEINLTSRDIMDIKENIEHTIKKEQDS